MADKGDDEDAPEELTLDEGRDAAESARKQENDNKKRLASEAKSKRRKQNEVRNVEKKKKKSKNVEQDEPELDFLTKKNSGFLDQSIVQFLVDKERKQLVDVGPPEVQADPAPIRKKKKKAKSMSINDRTKLVVISDAPSQARGEGAQFLKERLHGSHVERSLTMLKTVS